MRRVWVDNLRCFTVLLVVLYHCFYIFNSVGVFGGIGPLRPGDGQVQDIVEYTMYPWFMVLLFLPECPQNGRWTSAAPGNLSKAAV